MRRPIIALALAAPVVGVLACDSEVFCRGMIAALLVLIYDEMQ